MKRARVDQEPVGLNRGSQPDRPSQRRGMNRGHLVKRTHDRAQKLKQPREGKRLLGLDTRRAKNAKALRPPRAVLE